MSRPLFVVSICRLCGGLFFSIKRKKNTLFGFSFGPCNQTLGSCCLLRVTILLSSSQDAAAENAEGQQSNTIIFNSSKGELFTPNNGFKSLVRKLRSNWKVIMYVTASLYEANDKFAVSFTWNVEKNRVFYRYVPPEVFFLCSLCFVLLFFIRSE